MLTNVLQCVNIRPTKRKQFIILTKKEVIYFDMVCFCTYFICSKNCFNNNLEYINV